MTPHFKNLSKRLAKIEFKNLTSFGNGGKKRKTLETNEVVQSTGLAWRGGWDEKIIERKLGLSTPHVNDLLKRR